MRSPMTHRVPGLPTVSRINILINEYFAPHHATPTYRVPYLPGTEHYIRTRDEQQLAAQVAYNESPIVRRP